MSPRCSRSGQTATQKSQARTSSEPSATPPRPNLASEKTQLAIAAAESEAEAVQAAADLRVEQARTDRLLYVARVNLAQRAWEENNVGRVLQLLEETRPDKTGGVDLRGFEWFHLWNMCHADQLTFDAVDYVRCLAASPNGKWLATGGKLVKIFDAKTGERIRELPHPLAVETVAFSPNGRWLASGCRDHLVRIWNLETWEVLHELEEHGMAVHDLAFDSSGERLASVATENSKTGEIAIWDVGSGKFIRRLLDQSQPVFAVQFDPLGRFLATGDARGRVVLWNLERGRPAHAWRAGSTALMDLDISPDGKQLALAAVGADPP